MLKKPERVIAYIDGFNLYYSIRETFPRLKWLNPEALASNLLKGYQRLVGVKYFTSRITDDAEKERRQSVYLDAMASSNVLIVYGKYISTRKACLKCGAKWIKKEEKMTDVNIAVNMILDAYHNSFDAALLISGDSDLVPPIDAIHSMFPDKRVIVAFPPNRHNNSVRIAAKASFVIGRGKIAASQLPNTIILPGGIRLKKPQEWV